MLYIPKIDDYLKILIDEEVSFSEFFKTIREEQNLPKVTKPLCILLTTLDKIEKHVQSNYSDNCVHHNNVENLNLFDPD